MKNIKLMKIAMFLSLEDVFPYDTTDSLFVQTTLKMSASFK